MKHRDPPTPARKSGLRADPEAADLSKGDLRRQQLLDAAARCFREHGLRGTSIARISEASGMSAGHIYHYFRNKEAIVQGIVDRGLQQTLEQARALQESSSKIGIVRACIAQVDAGIAERASKEPASLMLDILAEATRNAAVAATLEEADRLARQSTLELIKTLPSISALPTREKAARVTVLYALFDGLIVRSLVDPELNQAATSKVIQRVVKMLLEDAADPPSG